MTRPKDIGTAAETAVARYLAANGFPHAERRALRGNLDCGDITGTPGICWEIKGGKAAATASDGQVAAWLDETEAERINARADVGILVMRRAGIGPANAGRWWAVMPFGTLMFLAPIGTRRVVGVGHPVRLHLADACIRLRDAGYGDPLEKDAS
jgi:hypothetical protein